MTLPLIARQRDESWQRICKYLVSLLVRAWWVSSFFFFLSTKTRSTETGNSNNERRNRIVLRFSMRVCVCIYLCVSVRMYVRVCVCVRFCRLFICAGSCGGWFWNRKWRRCVWCCSVLVSSRFGNFSWLEKFFLRMEVMCWLEIVVVYVCVDSRILDAILNRRGKV